MLDWIHTFRSTALDAFFRKITIAGSLYFVLPAAGLLGVFLLVSERYKEAKILVASVTFSLLLVHGAKVLFKRPRPDIHPPIVPMPVDWSFPSAHTAQITSISLCASLFAIRLLPGPWAWSVCVFCLLLTGFVGLSRVYLQVHYPSDVIAGFLLAGLVFGISYYTVNFL